MVDAGSSHDTAGVDRQELSGVAATGSEKQMSKHGQGAQQDDSATSSQQQLLQGDLSAMAPPGPCAPSNSSEGVTANKNLKSLMASAAIGGGSPAQAPVLPNLADLREMQLVAAAFAAGAAAGAAGQLDSTLPLLEQFSSGDVSHCGPHPGTPAAAAAAAAAQHGAAEEPVQEVAEKGKKAGRPKAGLGKQRPGAGGNLKSSFRGVFWDRKNNRWRSQVGHMNRKIFMGYFTDPADAARAYDKKLVQLRGTMAKTNFPLQDYADDLKLHKELRARENGDELLLLPLEELQAHLQQHLQELVPKQPALQKVYDDWSRNKAQAQALASLAQDSRGLLPGQQYHMQQGASMQFAPQGMQPKQQLSLLQQQMALHAHHQQQQQQGHVTASDSQEAAAAGHPASSMGPAAATPEAVAQAGAASADQLPPHTKGHLLPIQLEQQWSSSSVPTTQQHLQQQQQPSSHPTSMDVDPVLPAQPHVSQAEGAAPSCQQGQQQQQHKRVSSPGAAGSSRGSGSPRSWTTTAAPGGAGNSSGTGATPVGVGGHHRPHQREPPRSLQQHLLTRLHEQRVQRCSSGSSMDALLAAAAVLEEEEEVAVTLCEQLHQLVTGTGSPQPQQQQCSGQCGADCGGDSPRSTAAAGATAGNDSGGGMFPAAGQPAQTPAEAAAAAAAEAEAAAAAAMAATAAEAAAAVPGINHSTVVTETAAVVAAILRASASSTASKPQQQQQQDEGPQQPDHMPVDEQPGEEQQQSVSAALPATVNCLVQKIRKSMADAGAASEPNTTAPQTQHQAAMQGSASSLVELQRQMLQPPTTEQEVVHTIQMAHRAGLDTDSQQLLLLVMYHQLVDVQQKEQQPAKGPALQRSSQMQEQHAAPPKRGQQRAGQKRTRSRPVRQDTQQQGQQQEEEAQQHNHPAASAHMAPPAAVLRPGLRSSSRTQQVQVTQPPSAAQAHQPPPESHQQQDEEGPPAKLQRCDPSKGGQEGGAESPTGPGQQAEGGVGQGALGCTKSAAQQGCSITAAPGLLALHTIMSGDV